MVSLCIVWASIGDKEPQVDQILPQTYTFKFYLENMDQIHNNYNNEKYNAHIEHLHHISV
jgi:hypothetical protein